jgi:hypothetical protein
MGFSSPCGYDLPFVVIPIGIDDGDLDAVHQPYRINPHLAVIEPIIDPFHGWTVEDPNRIRKGNRVAAHID